MSIQKIKESELKDLGVSALPARPAFPSLYEGRALTAKELREAFDRLPRLIAERFNALLDACGLLDTERESLAEAIATELFEGHSLADLFRDIGSGALLSYLKNERGEDLSSLLLALASPKGEVGAGETGGVSGETVEARLLSERAEILRSAAGLYRLTHAEGSASVCLEVYKNGAWQTAGDLFSLPKDIFLKSGTVRTVTEDGSPEAGYLKGEKYLDLVLGGETERHIYVKVSDLIDTVSVTHTGEGDIVTALSSDGNTVTAERALSSSALVKREELAALDEVYAKREGLAALIRKTALLAHAAEGHAFAYETDDTAAYAKTVPAESDAYALLAGVGGISRGGNLFDESRISAHVAGGFSMTYDEEEGCLVLNGTLTDANNYALCGIGIPIAAQGKTLSFSYEHIYGSMTLSNAGGFFCFGSGEDSIGMPKETYGSADLPISYSASAESVPYGGTEGETVVIDSFLLFLSPVDTSLPFSAVFKDYRLRVMVNEGETAKPHAPYRITHAPVTAVRVLGKNLLPASVSRLEAWEKETGKESRFFSLDLPQGLYVISARLTGSRSIFFYVKKSEGGADFKTEAAVYTKDGKEENGYFITPKGIEHGNLYFRVSEGVRYQLWINNTSAKQEILDLIADLQIEPCSAVGEDPTAYSPYSSLTREIPQEILSLDGYGRGISEKTCNYIDLERGLFVRRVGERAYIEGDREDGSLLTDGVTTLYPLEEEQTVDISAYLTDSFLPVEGKGTLLFENAEKWDAPSEVTYQLKLTEGDKA